VEHERQRGILLGAGGGAMKALATAARREVEEFVGRPVYLQLSVKVQKNWRKDAQLLERLGY
jgi:GTP-binding protein Era